jgi:hypothetical protein
LYAGSYEWLMQLRTLAEARPENFNRVMTAPEKKILEQMLEHALGVSRKKAAAKKTAPKKAAAKRPPPQRTPQQKPK